MAAAFSSEGHEALAFGDFQLIPSERRLLRAGAPVRVGSRSLDILIALATRHGEILSKDALIALVWPDVVIEESALRVHISTLRKALGDGEGDVRLITNVPGRGYTFVAPVSTTTTAASTAAPATATDAAFPVLRLPMPVGRIIGRDDLIEELSLVLVEQRLVTIVGPGGMGKTTVAVALAQRLADAGETVAFADLAPLADGELVAGAVASGLGLAVRSADLVQEIAEAVRGRRLMLVLDSCEHVIEAAATLAERLLGLAPDLTLLATSREALRADGEWVHRLSPLALPPETANSTAADALAFPAVQLFVARASSVLGGFRLDEAGAPRVVEICRRLDGIALAIELAAARLDSMSLEALGRSLDNCFQVLTRGRRTALPRHQTLRGAVDWSYGILPVAEQLLLQRLAVFNGPFDVAAAIAVAADNAADAIEDGLLNLAAKSLLNAEVEGDEVRYRLLDTTRAYAREKLEASGEANLRRRRHATYYRDHFAAAEEVLATRPAEGLAESAGLLGNLRAALDWAFSPDGDGSIGVALTADAVPLWFQLSLVDECLGRVQAALTWLDGSPDPDLRVRMRLYAGLGFPQMRAITGFPSGVAAWRSVLEIAEQIGDADYQARALWALWTDRVNSGEARQALDFADRFARLSASAPDAADPLIAQRIRAWSRLMLGDLEAATADITAMLRIYGATARPADVARFQYDQRSTARITLARALWLRGDADQALRDVEDNIATVTADDHTLSLAHVLSDAACFLALWRGDLELADRYIALLRQHTGLQALDVWRTYGDCFEGEVCVRRGERERGVALLRSGIAQLEAAGFVCYHTAFLGVLAEALVGDGQAAEGLRIVEDAIARAERTGEGWTRAELLRIRGEALHHLDRSSDAVDSLTEALETSSAQGALSWELRAALSLARCQSNTAASAERLASVVGRFREGFDTADLRAANALLAERG
ncbi:winged helix-turn-helix domain-containing protein [Phenylobacterium sp.]|uniref:ATP-binding protein n=1 Tax=Phenylobacterium sp. TaxID=1871053 RepID=UPI00121E0480|nr:winged helix-turn-helix domain-containing protein [Phenylobacterium sp.]THD60573.1 MAG: transcriptional regulator [Phenylobacterium sp.]